MREEPQLRSLHKILLGLQLPAEFSPFFAYPYFPMLLNPRHSRFWPAIFFVILLLTCATALRSDEWKARHALVAPNGTMTLTIPPAPSEVFFAGPTDPSDPSWLAGMQAWRNERRTQLRLDESDYLNPDLAWTQRTFSGSASLVGPLHLRSRNPPLHPRKIPSRNRAPPRPHRRRPPLARLSQPRRGRPQPVRSPPRSS